MTSHHEQTPQDRLAVSRQAIVRYMISGKVTPAGLRSAENSDDTAVNEGNDQPLGVWPATKQAVLAWWNHHPAQLALDLAKPVLGKYAEDKPYQLLGMAALTGAAVVLVRPWRLVSLTGLVLATLKSSQASELLLSLLSSHTGQATNGDHS